MRHKRFRLINLAWATTLVTGLMLSVAAPASADPGAWDPTLPAQISAGAPGDPLAVANASLQATAQATQTTMDLGKQFLSGLGINLGGDPPADAARVPQRRQGIGLDHPHPPVQRSGGPGAREVEDVLVAGRRQQAAGRALALQDQVGDDGGAVEDQLKVLRRGSGAPAGLPHAFEHAHRLVRRRREHLDQGHVAGVGVLHLHVGEGAAHVYSQPVSHEVSLGQIASSSCSWRSSFSS